MLGTLQLSASLTQTVILHKVADAGSLVNCHRALGLPSLACFKARQCVTHAQYSVQYVTLILTAIASVRGTQGAYGWRGGMSTDLGLTSHTEQTELRSQAHP